MEEAYFKKDEEEFFWLPFQTEFEYKSDCIDYYSQEGIEFDGGFLSE